MILDGRDRFYQWDLDRKLIVTDESIDEVHFCNRTDDCSLICEVYADGELRLVDVPNILLTQDWRINVYAFDGNYTKHCEQYEVVSRTKPADYVYTETEIKNYDELLERVKRLEEGGISEDTIAAAVKEYLDENGVDVDLDGYATEQFVNEKIETIELTPGPQGPAGPAGKDGYTPVKGVDYFDGKDGKDGKNGRDGVDGQDGRTPVKGVDYFDGKNGKDGADGKDYVLTEADKQEIAGMVEVTGGGEDVDLTNYYTKSETDTAIQEAIDDIVIPGGGGGSVEEIHVGTTAPDDANIKIWVDTDEEANYPSRPDIINNIIPQEIDERFNGSTYSGVAHMTTRVVKDGTSRDDDLLLWHIEEASYLETTDYNKTLKMLLSGRIVKSMSQATWKIADFNAHGITNHKGVTSSGGLGNIDFESDFTPISSYFYWINGNTLYTVASGYAKYLPKYFNRFLYDFSDVGLSATDIPAAIKEVVAQLGSIGVNIDETTIVKDENGELKTALPYFKTEGALTELSRYTGSSILTSDGAQWTIWKNYNIPITDQLRAGDFVVGVTVNGVEYLSTCYINESDQIKAYPGQHLDIIHSSGYITINEGAANQYLQRVIIYTGSMPESDPTKIHSDSVVMVSPNGTKFKLSVSDDGTLSAVQM